MLELRVYASLLHPESESAGSADPMGVTIVRISLKACGREQPFQAAHYQLMPIIFQQLNFVEWPQFFDHCVTSADVRLSVGPNLSRAACQRPVDLASPRRGLVAHQNATPLRWPWTHVLLI